MTQYEHVHFRPWIGGDFATGGIFDLKVMILGESHYVWEDLPPPRIETQRIIERIARSDYESRFHPNVEIAVLGAKQFADDRRCFWNSVLFYNYLQEPLPNSRQPPAAASWQAAEPAFREVLERHAPQVILVLGKRLWGCLPGEGRPGPILHLGTKNVSPGCTRLQSATKHWQ